ncbi:hypothetical protein SLOPH_1150 [Spraguea lophii 42_110]|uniref:Uncharacterized protein n=1 Tax=Spraguea lophii (strain 42_110) TaxID=1358809 RepID=S7W6N0_SPRLO|nr:hypothetical protein SLOPH_1150 [Spraguea lophii 42_110]
MSLMEQPINLYEYHINKIYRMYNNIKQIMKILRFYKVPYIIIDTCGAVPYIYEDIQNTYFQYFFAYEDCEYKNNEDIVIVLTNEYILRNVNFDCTKIIYVDEYELKRLYHNNIM